jgi:hypothetical protein
MYFLIAASRKAESVAAAPSALSVMSDRDDWAHRDYEKVMRELHIQAHRAVALEKAVGEREAALAAQRQDAGGWIAERERMAEAIALRDAAIVQKDAELSRRAIDLSVARSTLAEKTREVDRRRGWRWWLRLPLVRLGLLSD